MVAEKLTGSFAALISPFQKNGGLDETSFIALIQKHIEAQTSGLVIGGTTGEGCALTESEFFRLLELALQIAGDHMIIVANTGTPNTQASITRTNKAAAMGAHACMLITPYYVKPTQDGLKAHFFAIHQATNVPLILYNVPSRTGVDLLPETLARLVQLERFVAFKDATGCMERANLLRAVLQNRKFSQLSGEDVSNFDHFLHGGVGAISVTANVVPRLMATFYKHCLEHRLEEARTCHEQLLPLHKALFCSTNPAPIKYALSLQGLCQPTLRLPLVELKTQEKEIVEQALACVESFVV